MAVQRLQDVAGFTENPITEQAGVAPEPKEPVSPPTGSAPVSQSQTPETSVPGEQLQVPSDGPRSVTEAGSPGELIGDLGNSASAVLEASLESTEPIDEPIDPMAGYQSSFRNTNLPPVDIDLSNPESRTQVASLGSYTSVFDNTTSTPRSSTALMAKTLPFVKQGEAFYSQAYPDPGSRDGTPWTIGYGQTRINGRPVKPGDTISEPEALKWVTDELARVESFVQSRVNVPLTEGQLAALTSFTYNVGDGAFNSSTLLKKLNAGDYSAVPTEMRKWVNNDGEFMQGLLNRRNNEINQLWLS